MKFIHLRAALLAAAVSACALASLWLYAGAQEQRYLRALAPRLFHQKNQGSALQRLAFQSPELLPFYGSSELEIADPYHAVEFFREYPTGFAVSPIGTADTESLIVIQKLAASGPDLRGKKVVISLSPSFFLQGEYHFRTYAGNFSPLHANELAFSTDLSPEVKRDIARRMLDYPGTLQDPLLKFALERLADTAPPSQALYYLALPLGKLNILILRLQDHWETLTYIRNRPQLKTELPRQPRSFDWEALIEQAEAEYQELSDNNPLGMNNEIWNLTNNRIIKAKGISSDQRFVDLLNRTKGWTDLDLLLRGLKDLGAEPLILSMPLKGYYHEWQGVSPSGRAVYYQKLEAAVRPYGFKVITFQDHDEDNYFLIDPWFHLSRKGWVYYDQALDAFYHGTLR